MTDRADCQCCDFGNHTQPCTCDGESCCHRERHKHGGLRDWITDAVRQGLAVETADPDSAPIEIGNRVLAVVEPLIQRKEDERLDAAVQAMEAEARARKLHAAFEELLSYFSDNDGDWYMYDPKIDGDTMKQWRALLNGGKAA
jgi:preprotein translocase subunit SecD